MFARASEAAGFTPAERPRIAISGDGTLAVIAETGRAIVLELPTCSPFAEVGIDPEASGSEVTWVGAPPRLLVLSRHAAHTTVHLIDPHGPRTVAEIRLETPMKLFASVGAHALAVGSLGAAVLSASESHVTPFQFPARAMPVTAGAAGSSFVVAYEGSIEEWDPANRMPKRRLRLPRPAVITNVGGSDRVVWMTTQAEPTRVEVVGLVNRGQPKHHDLPEPIAHVAGHPRSDLIVCVGATSGKLYVLDLDGRVRVRVLGPEGIERTEAAGLVIGRTVGVLAAQAHRPVAIVALDGRDLEAAQAPALGFLDAEPPPVRSTLIGDDDAPPARPPPPRATVVEVEAAPAEAPSVPRASVAQPAQPRSEHTAPSTDLSPTWRDKLVLWARAVAFGSAEREVPPAPALDGLAERFELAPSLIPAIALLYGAHLAGERGASPFDVARVLGRRWDEALGTGQLAFRGLARYADSRVLLAPAVQRALDDLPVITGTIVGAPGAIALLGPCVAIAAADIPLAAVAQRVLSSVGGAILAAFDDAEPGELFLEARARGAAPMLRVGAGDILEIGTDPAVLVVTDEAVADQLGVPRL